VLDAGCGAGADLAALQKVYPAAQVLGLDAAPAMLAEAGGGGQAPRSFLSRLLPAKAGVDLVCGDFGQLPSARTRSTWSGRTWRCTGIRSRTACSPNGAACCAWMAC
jgi:SAM-dependent methyltransferase